VLEAIRDTTKPAEPSVQIQLNDHKVRTLRPFYDAARPQGLPSERNSVAVAVALPPALPASEGTALSAPIPLLPMQVPAAPQSAREAAPAVPVPQTPGPTPTAAPLLQTAAAAPVAPPASAVRTPEPVVAKPSYVGPKAIRQMPASPLPASMPAGGSVSVQLRVEIAANGKVSKVTPTERHAANFKLVDAAIRAAQFWVFEPAQENGHPVPSEMLLNFHFGAQ
jgi:hypothetical protein